MGLITIDYRDRKLIYEQLIDNIKALILRGDLKKDDYLPSVRSLAKELGVNPNTIQKAYTELERQGIILSLLGRGSIVVQGRDEANEAGREALRKKMRPLLRDAMALGLDESGVREMLSLCWREMILEDKEAEISL